MKQHNYTLKELVDGYTRGEFDGLINGTMNIQPNNSRNFEGKNNSQTNLARFSSQSSALQTEKQMIKRLTNN
jgi:hypothetical protein